MTESAGYEFSTRFERHYRYFVKIDFYARRNGVSADTERNSQATSWGPLHIMGGVARELGYDKPLPLLGSASNGIFWGCKKLKTLYDKYEKRDDIIAAYNAGSPRFNDDGTFINQVHVDRVNRYLGDLES